MTTLACFCGGIIEGLVFLAWAGFAWMAGVLLRLRMRRPKPCGRQCCEPRSDATPRSD